MWWRKKYPKLSTRQNLIQGYVVLGVTFLITIVLLIFYFNIATTLDEIDKKGVQTQALVIKNEPERGKANRFHITYRFTVPVKNGASQTYEREAIVDKNSSIQLPVGAVAQVKYLPQSPDSFRLLNVSGDDYGLLVVQIFLAANTFLQILTIVYIVFFHRAG
ncbi:MAG: DUF3592 domain-containing protein [Chloroflexi bacterium]|uniref:DUF3592 domain-containing protein n=1 Tax=Candidatus Chlorohelix allophototropha TaxID=3003348 RepID=A0A8T7M6M3_9CHLR|nr:DUF3592 domain-containing protein [Chloroflexota bacterium]WJW69673.1 DUF3592 domain-containing protein [Chloroflexota bacterium L227-S17]